MPYENIPHVGSTYLDGAFKTIRASSQPKILILGTATSGRSYELFNVAAVSEAENEFGSDTELMKGVHEAIAQGADNVSIMRIGGTQGNVVVTDYNGETLTITPESRDNEILEKYTLIVEEKPTGFNRYLIYDLDAEEFVYDTIEVKTINTESFRIEDTGIDLYEVGDINDPSNAPTLAALIVGDFTALGASTIATVDQSAGTDGVNISLAERYAALQLGYGLLDFRDADFICPKNVFVDSPNQADGDSPDYASGPPVAGSVGDALGVVWHFIYQNKLYTYMAEDATTISTDVAEREFGTVTNGRVLIEANDSGPSGEEIRIKFTDTATAGSETVVVSGNDITIGIEDGVSSAVQIVSAITGSIPASALVTATVNVTGFVTIGSILASFVRLRLAGVLSHSELTGDVEPEAVEQRYRDSVSAEWRECNFAHQLASFCHLASTTWKPMIGFVSVEAPPAYDRISIGEWIGSLPTYVTKGEDLVIDTSGDNGTGLLGIKFFAGAHNYRNAQIEEGDSNDGYAYGGFIATKGTSLPNGSTFAYGILDTDEEVDSGGKPVDIGKFLIASYDWPIHNNSFDGGSRYRGSIEVSLAGKFAILRENVEPIGTRGTLTGLSDNPRALAVAQDSLSLIRLAGLRREDGIGLIIVDTKMAAHPDSDYTRPTIVRSVGRELHGIRNIAKGFLGRDYSAQKLQALQSSIEAFLQNERVLGFNQGANIALEYTRQDRILGKLKIRLRLVPPFTLRIIDTFVSLAADESEL